MGNPRTRLRFPQSSRLKSNATIRRIVAEGPRLLRQGYSAHWLPGTATGHVAAGVPPVAFVVSRHSGGAIARNRIRRRLREAVRLNRMYWPLGARIVLRAKGGVLATMPFESLMDEMKQTLLRIGGPEPR
jgi:ribonuclease P protein component